MKIQDAKRQYGEIWQYDDWKKQLKHHLERARILRVLIADF